MCNWRLSGCSGRLKVCRGLLLSHTPAGRPPSPLHSSLAQRLNWSTPPLMATRVFFFTTPWNSVWRLVRLNESSSCSLAPQPLRVCGHLNWLERARCVLINGKMRSSGLAVVAPPPLPQAPWAHYGHSWLSMFTQRLLGPRVAPRPPMCTSNWDISAPDGQRMK